MPLRNEGIMDTLEAYMASITSMGYTVAAIFLYGSQNYNLDIYTDEYQSDIDAKAIVIPTLDDLIYNSKPVSKIVEFDNGQVDVKDIRTFTETLVKANPAYIETLYTDFYVINPMFKDEINAILEKRDDLVDCLKLQFLRASCGIMMEKRKALCHPYPSIIDKIEKYGYDGKQSSHCIRLYDMIHQYFILKHPLKQAFYPEDKNINLIVSHKLNKPTCERAIVESDIYIEMAKEEREYVEANTNEKIIDYTPKYDIIELSRKIIKKCIIRSVKDGVS